MDASTRKNVRLDLPKSPTLAESQLARIREIVSAHASTHYEFANRDTVAAIAAVLDWTESTSIEKR